MQINSLNSAGVEMRSSSITKAPAAKLQLNSQMDVLFGNNCERSGNEKVRTVSGCCIKRK